MRLNCSGRAKKTSVSKRKWRFWTELDQKTIRGIVFPAKASSFFASRDRASTTLPVIPSRGVKLDLGRHWPEDNDRTTSKRAFIHCSQGHTQYNPERDRPQNPIRGFNHVPASGNIQRLVLWIFQQPTCQRSAKSWSAQPGSSAFSTNYPLVQSKQKTLWVKASSLGYYCQRWDRLWAPRGPYHEGK